MKTFTVTTLAGLALAREALLKGDVDKVCLDVTETLEATLDIGPHYCTPDDIRTAFFKLNKGCVFYSLTEYDIVTNSDATKEEAKLLLDIISIERPLINDSLEQVLIDELEALRKSLNWRPA